MRCATWTATQILKGPATRQAIIILLFRIKLFMCDFRLRVSSFGNNGQFPVASVQQCPGSIHVDNLSKTSQCSTWEGSLEGSLVDFLTLKQ